MGDHRDFAASDAEIEAEFQSVVARTKAAGQRKRGHRIIGAPLAFLAAVCKLAKGRAPLAVALLIFRRTIVCRNRTVTLPNPEYS
jgi:hypothetical protein